MTNRREEILQGIISFPMQILDLLKATEEQKVIVLEFWKALVHNFMLEKTLDTITWYEKFNNKDLFNIMLYHLCKSQWINVITEMNYSCIELRKEKLMKWVSDEEIQNIKFRNKFLKYRYKLEPSDVNNLVKINGKIKKTGLVRNGFMKVGNHKFTLDVGYLDKYFDSIQYNIFHGLHPTEKDISYNEVGLELMNFYTVTNEEFNLNRCLLDSRGRSIFQCTRKIMNPISSKDCRAMIVLKPQELTKEGEKNVYLAISELLGYRPNTLEEKIALGREAYKKKLYPSVEKNNYGLLGDHCHEYIWLERLYENLDNPKVWTTPIDCDAMSSLLQMMGVLTNCHLYLYGTNLADDGTLHDMWTIEGLPRKLVKKAMTPLLYGSSATVEALWEHNKLDYTDEHCRIIKKEMLTGRFCHAIDFKNFLITNCNMKPKMKVHILDEVFDIECNKYKWQEKQRMEYFIYSMSKIKKIVREVERVPDLKRFKTYVVTLLCHNLDSQVANYIGENMKFVLTNHDSFR